MRTRASRNVGSSRPSESQIRAFAASFATWLRDTKAGPGEAPLARPGTGPWREGSKLAGTGGEADIGLAWF